MFVVPNNIVGQWEKIFTDLYPQAKLLTIEPKSFKPELRKKILTQLRDGDYDGIIIAYSCFEMIPLSEKYITEKLKLTVSELEAAVADISNLYYSFGRTAINRAKEYIIKLTSDLLKSMKAPENSICFDDLDINTVFLDETHNFKNIPIRTKLKNLKVKRAADISNMKRELEEIPLELKKVTQKLSKVKSLESVTAQKLMERRNKLSIKLENIKNEINVRYEYDDEIVKCQQELDALLEAIKID
ncbi:MAG: hypothetical protein IJ561_07605 [Ruminococcus sp.]|nr:hypothetical protein [Ruminococcus sp.]